MVGDKITAVVLTGSERTAGGEEEAEAEAEAKAEAEAEVDADADADADAEAGAEADDEEEEEIAMGVLIGAVVLMPEETKTTVILSKMEARMWRTANYLPFLRRSRTLVSALLNQ